MNDLIRLAMERAVGRFGDRGDGLFNSAGFSQEFAKLAGVRGMLDGLEVRAMLTGRQDVEPLAGGAHWQLKAHTGAGQR